MPSTPRGFPYPTLAAAADVPFWLQSLAEALDAQLQTLDDTTFKKAALTLPGAFERTTTTARQSITELQTGFSGIAGHRYRITLNVATSSTVATDVTQLYIQVSGVDVGEFPSRANSESAGTSNFKTAVAYWTAPNTAGRTVNIQHIRAAGTGTVKAFGTALLQASVLVEDMGVA